MTCILQRVRTLSLMKTNQTLEVTFLYWHFKSNKQGIIYSYFFLKKNVTKRLQRKKKNGGLKYKKAHPKSTGILNEI